MTASAAPPAPPSSETLARLRAGFAHVPSGSGTGSVGPEQIWAAVHGEPGADREAVIDQLHTDPQLALEWRLAAALGPIATEHQKVEPEVEPEVHAQVARPRWATSSVALGVAFAAAAAVLLWVAAPSPSDSLQPASTEPTLRAPQGEALLQTPLSVDDPLPRTDVVLRWSSEVPGEPSFTLRVTTRDLQPIYEQDGLTTTTVRVPEAALASVPSGAVLLWRVEAVESDGRRHASKVWELAVE